MVTGHARQHYNNGIRRKDERGLRRCGLRVRFGPSRHRANHRSREHCEGEYMDIACVAHRPTSFPNGVPLPMRRQMLPKPSKMKIFTQDRANDPEARPCGATARADQRARSFGRDFGPFGCTFAEERSRCRLAAITSAAIGHRRASASQSGATISAPFPGRTTTADGSLSKFSRNETTHRLHGPADRPRGEAQGWKTGTRDESPSDPLGAAHAPRHALGR